MLQSPRVAVPTWSQALAANPYKPAANPNKLVANPNKLAAPMPSGPRAEPVLSEPRAALALPSVVVRSPSVLRVGQLQ